MKNKISIVTPSYNQGQFIEEAIQSVLKQVYENFEHIIIDGGSTDNTLAILKKYPHLKWVSEKDNGQSHALNKGFNKATGDIIGWLNADDRYLPGVFDRVNEEMKREVLDALFANYKFIDEKGNITRKVYSMKPLKWILLYRSYIPSTTFFFRQKLIKDGIKIDESFEICMDQEFFAHILHADYKLKHIDDFFAHFRWHENNKSIDTKEIKEIRYEEGKKILNRYSAFNIKSRNLYKLMTKFVIFLSGLYKRTINIFNRSIK